MRKQAVPWLVRLALLLLAMPVGQAPARHSKVGRRHPPIPLAKADAVTQAELSSAYGRLPLSFEANQGQTDSRVKFLSRGKGYSLYLSSTEAVLGVGKADDTSPNIEQLPASFDRLPQTPFSPLQLPDFAPRIAHSAFRTPRSQLRSSHAVVLRMELVGSNMQPQLEGLEELPGKVNYFLGNDPKRWRTDVPTYGKVKYHDVYPGIDLVYYGQQQQLEYDLVVAPGADPRSIRLSFEGTDKLEVDAEGKLILHTAGGELVQHAPNIYQERNGRREELPGRYVLLGAESSGLSTEEVSSTPQQVGFKVGGYDSSRALVIDPVLVYSTYLGGTDSRNEFVSSIAVDPTGNAYVTGLTWSPDFPTANGLQPGFVGGMECGDQHPHPCPDAFVTKLSPAGNALVYSTFLGGTGWDEGRSIAVDSAGNAYLTGRTGSRNFPTANPLQPNHGDDGFQEGGDAFVAKLNPAGSALVYSTYLGGSDFDESSGIAADSVGNAYVTGFTSLLGFPISKITHRQFGEGEGGAFIVKFSPTGSELLYSALIGSTGGPAVAVDTAGNAYLTGGTSLAVFPTMKPLQPTLAGGSDAFVAKLNSAGTALLYSTYLGGSGNDGGSRIAVDTAGNAYVTGSTDSADFPTANALRPAYGGGTCQGYFSTFPCQDAFVAKLNAAGTSLVYSTYLGGSGNDGGSGITVDSSGNAYVTGGTNSPDFPMRKPLQPSIGGGTCYAGYDPLLCADVFVTKLNAVGTAMFFSTYLGGSNDDSASGIAVDPTGNAYVTGTTTSTDFPTANPLQPALNGTIDAFVAKIFSGALPVTIDIKPGGSPNSINPRSSGNIPLAVLTTNSYDASSVDPNTIRFGHSGQETSPLQSRIEDIDGDGDLDLVLHFATQQTGILCGDSSVRLTGKTFDGQSIEGADTIRTVGCK